MTADELDDTGAQGTGPMALAAMLAVLLGFAVRTGVSRSRQRS